MFQKHLFIILTVFVILSISCVYFPKESLRKFKYEKCGEIENFRIINISITNENYVANYPIRVKKPFYITVFYDNYEKRDIIEGYINFKMYYLWNCKWKTILNGKSHTFSVDLMKIFKIKKIEYGINKNITAKVDLVKDFPDALKKLTNTDRLHRFDMKLVQFRSQKGIFCIHAYAVINSNG